MESVQRCNVYLYPIGPRCHKRVIFSMGNDFMLSHALHASIIANERADTAMLFRALSCSCTTSSFSSSMSASACSFAEVAVHLTPLQLHSCAVNTTGTYCWGRNSEGQVAAQRLPSCAS
jgi:hypothetical protein